MYGRNFRRFTFQRNAYLVPHDKIVEKPFQEDYDVRQEIGRGGYGICRLVQMPGTHKYFVAKIIKKKKPDNSDGMKYVFNEIQLQANLKHKNLVGLEKVYVDNGAFTLITEFCFYGCLQDLIEQKGDVLGEGERRHIIHGILCGARYLHHKFIVHGDIKPLNVFISKELIAKLGDFGMAHNLDQEDCFGGTLNYFAPEMFQITDERHTTKTDVWAIGCTAYFTYTGESLFKQTTSDRTPQVRRQISRNLRHNGWYKLPFEVRHFLHVMTHRDPAERPECSNLIRHPFLMRRNKRMISTEVLKNLTPCIIDPNSTSQKYKKI